MNKTELIARIAETAGLTKKDSETALNATLAAVQESLVSGEKVVLDNKNDSRLNGKNFNNIKENNSIRKQIYISSKK